MNNIRVLIAAGLRLFAIWFIYTVVNRISFQFAFFEGDMTIVQNLYLFTFVVSSLVLSAVLLLWPYTLARMITPGLDHEMVSKGLEQSTLYRLGIVLLGLWVAIQGILGISYWLMTSLPYLLQANDVSFLGKEMYIFADLIQALIELSMGVFMIFGYRRILGWIRYSG